MATEKTALTIDNSQLVDGPTETANASDVTTPLNELLAHNRNGLLSVSADDTHVKTLSEALTVAGSGITATEQDDGANETYQLALATKLEQLLALLATGGKVPASAVDSTGASNGDVLTSNGSGGASFSASGGGGATPVDLTVTAGEDLALRDMVFLDESDGEWYKIDIDADPIACGPLRGCVNESGGITNNNTGSVRILGEVSGFTGLTAWGRVWAHTTAGSYTQTKPEPTLGGSQVVVAEMGRAVSTTAILIQPRPVQYMLADTVADDGTLTLNHHIDEQGRERDLTVYLASESAGVSLASYASANQDADVHLEGATLAGDSITITASGGSNFVLGDTGGTDYQLAQQFTTINGGELTELTFTLAANVGSPTGDVTWQIMTDNADEPGSELATGTKTPTPSATNTVSSLSVLLEPATKYWLVLSVPAQSTGNSYSWQRGTVSSYAGGFDMYSSDGGSSWTPSSEDSQCAFTISATTELDKLAQSFEVTGAQTVKAVDLWLKKIGMPAGTMTLRIETDNTGEPSGTLVHANATTTLAESSLGTSYADATFTFTDSFSIADATTYWIVLSTDRSQSDTNYVSWGADASTPSYADGEMMSEVSSSWGAESKDAIFEVFAEGVAYDSPALVDDWNSLLAVFVARYDDGSGSNPNTNTTVKNATGVSKDVIAVVELH